MHAQPQESEVSSDDDPVVSSTRRSRSTTTQTSFSTIAGVEYSSDSSATEQRHSSTVDEFDADDSDDSEQESSSHNEISDISDDEIAETTWSTFPALLDDIETKENILLHYPKSLHIDYNPPQTPYDEQATLKLLLPSEQIEDYSNDQNDLENDDNHPPFQQFDLTDFVIYGSMQNEDLRGQMQSPHVVAAERNNPNLNYYVDGYLNNGGTKHYLERAHIGEVSIGGLEEKEKIPSVQDYIYIQTRACHRLGHGSREQVWYRLVKPVEEYAKIYNDFLWLADLLKHFTDFLELTIQTGKEVELADFREQFLDNIQPRHRDCDVFRQWHSQCEYTKDFRKHIVRHASFLFDQVSSLGLAKNHEMRLWDEIYPFNRPDRGVGEEQTVVTEMVRYAFSRAFPHWSTKFDLLKVVEPSQDVQEFRLKRMRAWSFPNKCSAPGTYHSQGISLSAETLEKAARVGQKQRFHQEDIIGKVAIFRRNDLQESDANFVCSYAFVREFVTDRHQPAFIVVWLKHPGETACGTQSHYPFGNELFISDECCCRPVLLSHVMATFSISMLADDAKEGATFFTRQKYIIADKCFVTAKASDLTCTCQRLKSDAPTKDDQHHRMVPGLELRNLSLFAGAGILDSGLGAGGIIKTTCAVDMNAVALSSHAANTHHECNLVVDSVNNVFGDFLQDASLEFDMVSGGTPCQGFSALNNHRSKKDAQKKCSLVASAVSFVERFLPLYVLLENVPQMNRGSPSACEQVICCLVALGYQVRTMLLKACDFGAPQIRERLFIIAAASVLDLPKVLVRCVSSKLLTEAIRHLDPVDNDVTVNVKRPDHVPVERLKLRQFQTRHSRPSIFYVSLRSVVHKIPKTPTARTLYQTIQSGLLSYREKTWFNSLGREQRAARSKTLSRIEPDKPASAIVTKILPLCSRTGRVLHPTQDRVLSLEEIEIIQGLPEDFLLIGPLSKQVEQAGNGVAYPVAAALGRAIGHDSWCGWLGNHPEAAATMVEERNTELELVTRSTSVLSIHEDEAQALTNPPNGLTTVHSSKQARTPAPMFDSDSSSSDEAVQQLNHELMSRVPLDKEHRQLKRRQTSESGESDDKLVPPRPSPPAKRLKGSMRPIARGRPEVGTMQGDPIELSD